MKNLEYIDTAFLTEVGTISQHQDQYENYSIEIYIIPEDFEDIANEHNVVVGDYVLVEDAINQSYYYKLDDEEISSFKLNKKDFLESHAREWASNCDDTLLELLHWGIVSSISVSADYEGEVGIIIEKCMNGFSPIDFYTDDDGQIVTFNSVSEANSLIDEKEKGVYYLQHNESCRPTYTVVEL